ncbi:alpha/beta hydrolase [Candidatus Mycobacterium wuenschmannii]|uniref:Alpha/beta hydrolase n=1 Tax=Candidatus Mycobacterium wuenschmannii TaxID=3027808 RepID=A0ABY8VT75_9MYCO|nr:alpha/beta hydrolase [Candidatus Mycobacterium wuenschmannii]WIM86230.1 alpha/beta hydrolase [Candidatus Mycobacterium wuenschmannii]
MTLDPQLEPLIEALDAGFPPVHTMTGAQARATIKSRFARPLDPEPVAEVRDVVVPGPGGDIPVRIYRPSHDASLPILIYGHGGGFVFCDLDSHDGLCRDIANRTPAVIISVDYRLAPEHPWPAAAEDFYAAAQWAADNAADLGGDAQRIVLGGDSAGGNLAAVTAVMTRDRGGHPIAAQLLIYPVIAANFATESYRLYGKGFYNPEPAMRWYWDQYVPAVADRKHPYASPLQADLAGLPPAVVVIAGHDPLRDEGLMFADALDAAGVSTARCVFEGGIHGFVTMPTLGIAQQARQESCRELSRLLG